MNITDPSSTELSLPQILISAHRISQPVIATPISVSYLTCTALNCWGRRKTLQRLHRELLNFGNDRTEYLRGRDHQPRLSRVKRHVESVRCRRPHPVRQRPAGRASILPATRESKHGVFP